MCIKVRLDSQRFRKVTRTSIFQRGVRDPPAAHTKCVTSCEGPEDQSGKSREGWTSRHPQPTADGNLVGPQGHSQCAVGVEVCLPKRGAEILPWLQGKGWRGLPFSDPQGPCSQK